MDTTSPHQTRVAPTSDLAPATGEGDQTTTTNSWRSEELLHGNREVLIQHGQEFYRLRLTRAGKLILYK